MSRTLRELFVDRTRQLNAFEKLIDARIKWQIMVLTAGPGMGKSWVLRTYEQVAKERNLPHALIDFADGNPYDALTLVTRSRDLLGAQHFTALTQTIIEATTPQARIDITGLPADSVNVDLTGATVSGSVNVSPGATNITGNTFNILTSDPLIRRAVEDRINGVFFTCLAGLTAQQRAVFLFDSYGRLVDDDRDWSASAANRWIVDELLARVRDGRLPNVIVVIAGRSAPEFGIEWNDVLGKISLEPLALDDIRTYLRERRGLGIITDAELERLSQAIGGNPSVLGIVGDNLEQANTPVKDDEW